MEASSWGPFWETEQGLLPREASDHVGKGYDRPRGLRGALSLQHLLDRLGDVGDRHLDVVGGDLLDEA